MRYFINLNNSKVFLRGVSNTAAVWVEATLERWPKLFLRNFKRDVEETNQRTLFWALIRSAVSHCSTRLGLGCLWRGWSRRWRGLDLSAETSLHKPSPVFHLSLWPMKKWRSPPEGTQSYDQETYLIHSRRESIGDNFLYPIHHVIGSLHTEILNIVWDLPSEYTSSLWKQRTVAIAL